MPVSVKPTGDPLLVDAVGHVECLLGNDAVVRGAVEAGVVFASGYPGTPSSEVTDSFARISGSAGIHFEYSVNEKIALEMAFAASLAGGRAICAMKHLGLMAAGDPLSTIPYVGAVGGLVIVSAGDPSCHTSPNEQDQRHLGPMLHLPTLDPATPAEAHAMARGAFELSEESRLPVLLRMTARVSHSSALITYGALRPPRATGFVRDPNRFVPIPSNARRLRLEIPGRLAIATEWMSRAGLFRREGTGSVAILASGAPAATCADLLAEAGMGEGVVLASLGGLHPLPERELLELLADVETVLVVEELSPFVEDALAALCQRHGLQTEILGKRTGHLPTEFEYEPGVVAAGLHTALGLGDAPVLAPPPDEAVAPRPPVLCVACPHRSAYFAARAAFGPEQLYFNDIGCYTLGFGPPLDCADALLCMGAGFTLAAGVGRVTGQRTVGFLGDSTFFHSGMPALLDAIKEDADLVAVILDNQVTAMTGFQESPGVTLEGDHLARGVSIEGIVRALGARQVETVDPMDLAATIAVFERARDAKGVAVVITQSPCPLHLDRETGHPEAAPAYRIDQDACQRCGRDACGMRCDQGVTPGLERAMTRARSLDATVARGAERPMLAACEGACPVGLCVQGYAGHIAAGQDAEAYQLIMSRCPLPDTVCRVCHRPCETACVRGAVDQPVAINDLKRFVTDRVAAHGGQAYDPPRANDSGKAVAIVGAGPAGLAAAHDLRLRGHAVTLLDAAPEPGGVLRSGIPGYRLPREAVARDVARILDLGVSFRGDTRLGRDITVDGLLADGFDAVLLATGAGRARGLDVEGVAGSGRPEVLNALSYLEMLTDGRSTPDAARVVVVGGGNAACDAARSAIRRGAREVVIAYRRSRDEMPALVDEVAAAEREGITIATRLSPLAIQRGGSAGLLCVATEPGEPDASGRCRPRPVAGSERLLDADLVIIAVGQDPDLDYALGQIDVDERGCLRRDPETGATSQARVFAAGDVVDGDRMVTTAMASGQRAAWGIDRMLMGDEVADRRAPPPQSRDWPVSVDVPVAGRAAAARRRRPAELSAEQSRQGFDEVVGTLSEDEARAEAARCAICGQCGNCRACLDLFGCPAFYIDEGKIHIDESLCTGCGVCADFCSNGAIVPTDGRSA